MLTKNKFWYGISIFNLVLVAFLGVIMRYKIVFALPFVNQKYLLHAHSHFAFSGWVTQALMTLIIAYLSELAKKDAFPAYRRLLSANLITAYGMLFSFPFQGYGAISITFSTLSIIVFWLFSIACWRDLNRYGRLAIPTPWLKAALAFGCISALGVFGLSYLMVQKINYQHGYLAAVYFFLHFQYNGWFFFTCMGLFIDKIKKLVPGRKIHRRVFLLFFLSCIPAYFLSALWLPIPGWLYWLVVISAAGQLTGWGILLAAIWKARNTLTQFFTLSIRWLLVLSAIALTVKLILQLGSTLPSLSQLAYGFRPIVIAYLHLVLLGVISVYLLTGFLDAWGNYIDTRFSWGIWLFVFGIILNELLLMIQGTAALTNNVVPFINIGLLLAALILFAGSGWLFYGFQSRPDLNHKKGY